MGLLYRRRVENRDRRVVTTLDSLFSIYYSLISILPSLELQYAACIR